MISPRFFVSLLVFVSSAAVAEPVWIWSGKQAKDREQASFKTAFDLPGEVKSATLRFTCDNGALAYINGKGVAENPDWQRPTQVDVVKFLSKGANEIRIDAKNSGGTAGLIAKLEIELKDGKKISVETSDAWLTVPTNAKDDPAKAWKKAVMVGKHGDSPWGKALDGKAGDAGGDAQVIAAKDVGVAKGFKVEMLYNVPKIEQGSWVALTVDAKGRLFACDQYGSIYRMALPPVGTAATLQPEKLAIELGKAHGLLCAFDSLYVMVNENGKDNGLYRLRDTNGDDQYDKTEKLVTMQGGGEHGLHSMVVSPDGKRIFFNSGNHTRLPEVLHASRPAKIWDEDHILPRMWDANGHARGILAPGGFVCSMDPDGQNVELFCFGFRNEFDIAFDLDGQLFTYDADMEWDIGTPWYRPTRVNHCVSGADFGWRSGSGKWPDYYPDNLPTTLDIGPGSPTGVVAGTGAKFPEKYQRAVFMNDWTYGTMWAIHLTPQGASYVAEKEEFVFGKPLPLTDVIINPNDGAMYFAVGGRRTQSGVYRVTYVGGDSAAPAKPRPPTEEVKQRAELESLHVAGVNPQTAIEKAWPYLSHGDRHLRYAARVAIERQPVDLWKARALAETNPQALIEAIIALARQYGDKTESPAIKPKPGSSSRAISPVQPQNAEIQIEMLRALGRLGETELALDQKLAAVRALQLVLIRLGKPGPEVCEAIADKIEAGYPAGDARLNRELCQVLIAVDSPRVVAKTLSLMATAKDDWEAVASEAVLARNEGYANAAKAAEASRPNKQQIAYMFALRNATAGWTPELRRTFFSWFPRARTWKGGNSFKGFIENIRKEALANFAPQPELAELDALSSKTESVTIPNFVAPKGPGRAWTIDEILALTKGGLKGRGFENGKNMFSSVMCLTCHRFNGDGGGIGPDVTGAGNRYTMRDLLENIIEPSKVISDQYDSHQIEKTDGTMVIGRVIVQENGKTFVMTNPFAPHDHVAINDSEIRSRKTYPVSMMPPSLINALNADELLDLLAYMLSGGNAQDKAFKP